MSKHKRDAARAKLMPVIDKIAEEGPPEQVEEVRDALVGCLDILIGYWTALDSIAAAINDMDRNDGIRAGS